MRLLGIYPFLVYVGNTFSPHPKWEKVDVNVELFSHLTYYDKKNRRIIIEDIDEEHPGSNTILIPAGVRIAVPIFFADEYLDISLTKQPDCEFYFKVGATAKVYPRGSLSGEEPKSSITSGEDEHGKFYCGVTWDIPPTKEMHWSLEIRKFGGDPEEVDTSVGPRGG